MRVAPDTPLPAALRRLEVRLQGRWVVRTIAAVNVVLLALTLTPFVLWETLGPRRFDALELGGVGLETLDVETDETAPTVTISDTTTVTLVFSVGSRGMSRSEAERLRIDDPDARGGDGLTDSMMLLVADTATRQAALLSIPRDLWLFDRGHRINATFNLHGIQALVDDVSDVTGLPVHHVVQVNFQAAARLVDAVGGVALRVDRPLADLYSVLYVPEAGCWRFDGAAALAWARSRHTLTRTGDDWGVDGTASDFGRIQRQQRLLGAVWDQIRGPQLIAQIPDLLGVARSGLVVDDGLGIQQVRDLAASFADVAAGRVEAHTLPTRGRRIGGAAAQVLRESDAAEILDRLRAWPPQEEAATMSLPLLAAPADGPWAAAATLEGGDDCRLDAARSLPDPRPHLGGIAARMDAGASAGDRDDTADDAPTPPDDGTSGPSPTPTPTGSPSDDATPTPEPSPSDDPSDDDDLIDLPFGDG